MFIKTTTHKRIVAKKDAEIAGLMKRLRFKQDSLRYCDKRITELKARLAPFTKIRNRDAKGRFIKDTVA